MTTRPRIIGLVESRSRLAEHNDHLVMFARLRSAQSFLRTFATLSPNRLKQEALNSNQKITTLDTHLLSRLPSTTPLHTLIADYLNNAGCVLPTSLPYNRSWIAGFQISSNELSKKDWSLVLVAHCVSDMHSAAQKVTISSGFMVDAPSPIKGESLVVTCAHSLEEASRIPTC